MTSSSITPSHEYIVARIRTALSTDPRASKQDVRVAVRGDCVHLLGEASTEERRRMVGEIVAELVPEMRVCNELTVIRLTEVGEAERIQ